MTALEAQGVSKRFADVHALVEISLTVDSGEVLCLLGPNGAGKTTLINVFLGFVRPDSGNTLVLGIDSSLDPVEARKKMSYVPERVALYPELTALQNIEFFTSFLPSPKERQDLQQHLIDVGLDEEFHNKKTKGFSKGMSQKVGLAIALSKGAEVALMDEPLTGLDPVAAAELVQHVVSLRESGTAILLATHDIFHVAEVATRIGLLRNGNLVDLIDAQDITAYELEKLYLGRMSI